MELLKTQADNHINFDAGTEGLKEILDEIDSLLNPLAENVKKDTKLEVLIGQISVRKMTYILFLLTQMCTFLYVRRFKVWQYWHRIN